MCNCKTELERKLTERFAEHQPLASNLRVELTGYGFSIIDNKMELRPFMEARATADFPLKKGGTKHRSIKELMVFSFCPFCGERFSKWLREEKENKKLPNSEPQSQHD